MVWTNRRGIPVVPTLNVTVGTDNIIVTLPNHTFLNTCASGVLLVYLQDEIISTTALPILIQINEETRPLVTYGNEAVTTTNTKTGYYQIFYNKEQNVLQLL